MSIDQFICDNINDWKTIRHKFNKTFFKYFVTSDTGDKVEFYVTGYHFFSN